MAKMSQEYTSKRRFSILHDLFYICIKFLFKKYIANKKNMVGCGWGGVAYPHIEGRTMDIANILQTTFKI